MISHAMPVASMYGSMFATYFAAGIAQRLCTAEMALLHSVGEPRRRVELGTRPWTAQRLAPLAAAATIVVAVGLFGVGRWRDRAGTGEITRGGTAEPALVAPTADSTLSGDSVRFVWRPASGAYRYTLEVDADGTVLYTAPIADTTLVAPLGTVATGEHRWSVRALLDDGSERRSESRVLRLTR
jgi:hypothetical protein